MAKSIRFTSKGDGYYKSSNSQYVIVPFDGVWYIGKRQVIDSPHGKIPSYKMYNKVSFESPQKAMQAVANSLNKRKDK